MVFCLNLKHFLILKKYKWSKNDRKNTAKLRNRMVVEILLRSLQTSVKIARQVGSNIQNSLNSIHATKNEIF